MKEIATPATVPAKAPSPQGPSLSAHYLSSRVRFDSWNKLRTAVSRLATGKGSPAEYIDTANAMFAVLEPIEYYWGFPGHKGFALLKRLMARKEYRALEQMVKRIVRALVGQSYRRISIPLNDTADWEEEAEERAALDSNPGSQSANERPYFEVLIVDETSEQGEQAIREGLFNSRRQEDPFIYDTIVVPSFEDALIAILLNFNIQAVVVRYGIPLRSRQQLDVLKYCMHGLDENELEFMTPSERAMRLSSLMHEQRPELDLYLVTNESVEDAAGDTRSAFRRVFYQQENFLELHLNILRGVRSRADTPFFKALRNYAEQPTGVFHAMPISRGKSILKSHWIQDMKQFYGTNIFLAETSATSGGLDSLLDPTGPIKEAQELAARAFGAKQSYFVTNGTTGANKIVCQALVRPDDIVLIDRDCHKSHHYAMVLTGAKVVYLDAYPLHNYSMYGAVSIKEIRRSLLELKAAGKLDRVRLIILTNCTFDGIVYHPQRVMQECLAIKPDLIFLWDEAWFAFARFSPTYRQRTAMESARILIERYRSSEYLAAYNKATDQEREHLPDPKAVRVRVYATQSTHKTLTALRQGSMIHVYDQDYSKVEGAFRDAYMTHTSTSPNYQILASLDLGRRQVELEGFEMVGKQVEIAFGLREKITNHPLLAKWFSFLSMENLIPEEFRPSGLEVYYDKQRGWSGMLNAWAEDEFVLDPSRLTLYIGKTGIDGDTFKKDHLMERHGIQVNKTTRNSVLFMTNIGTTHSSAAHLIDALVNLASNFDETAEEESHFEKQARNLAILSYTEQLPPLPDFSSFHPRFRYGETPEGDMRTAYFLGNDEDNCEYFRIDKSAIDDAMESGRIFVASSFLTPYPPGFPILVPGQILSTEILSYLRALDTKEIHGYRAELGIRVFTEAAIDGKR
ncbi:MAG: aminotransferase class I/II-fold pyridoxal phosphate-dependent enzyme [Steroidobacteraceae bacterium]